MFKTGFTAILFAKQILEQIGQLYFKQGLKLHFLHQIVYRFETVRSIIRQELQRPALHYPRYYGKRHNAEFYSQYSSTCYVTATSPRAEAYY